MALKKFTIRNVVKCNPCSIGISTFKKYAIEELHLGVDDEVPLNETILANRLWMDFLVMHNFVNAKEVGYKFNPKTVARYNRGK